MYSLLVSMTESTCFGICDTIRFQKISCLLDCIASSQETSSHFWNMAMKPNHSKKLIRRIRNPHMLPGISETESARTVASPDPTVFCHWIWDWQLTYYPPCRLQNLIFEHPCTIVNDCTYLPFLKLCRNLSRIDLRSQVHNIAR